MFVKQLLTSMLLIIIGTVAASAETIPDITTEVLTDFGTYRPVPVSVSPSVQSYSIGDNLSDINYNDNIELPEDTVSKLMDNHFVATAGPYSQIYDIYNMAVKNELPVFVTTDACLHTYHVLYDYILRILETDHFIDDAIEMTDSILFTMRVIEASATDPAIKAAALQGVAYLSVPLLLLDPDALICARVENVVRDEVSKILEGSDGYTPSPLFYSLDYPYEEDYSQYKPRGHYTRSEALERYFRAMMWYGRMTFSFTLEGATDEEKRRATLQGILVAEALNIADRVDITAQKLWRNIYDPTVFFVGEADDILYTDYVTIAQDVFGQSFTMQALDIYNDTVKLDTFIAQASDLPDPKIDVKAGKGLRLMGQRYIPDSYMLDQLVEIHVRNRLMPRGLDVMAVLGSERAYEIVDTVYNDPTLYPDYAGKIALLRDEFANLPTENWAQNLYFNWLYTLVPLLEVKGEGYPMFMRNQAWIDKGLNTALGSWAELRHDTILYVKQSEPYGYGSSPVPDMVRGYVEPEPEVYARLAALASYMTEGLASRGLLNDMFDHRLADFERLMRQLMAISVKELENTPRTNDEYVAINNFGPVLEKIVTFPPEFQTQHGNDVDINMAVIADVHTDPNLNEALEVAVGHPLNLYVIAMIEGTPTLTRGAQFSYHEFKQPLSEGRLTDEEWQEMQGSANAVDMPVWTKSFLSGPSSLGSETYSVYTPRRLVTSVEKQADVPEIISLMSNSPNPFNPSTTITFYLPTPGHTTLTIYNLAGQEIAVLVDGVLDSGQHQHSWTPNGLGTGIYIARITMGEATDTLRMLFVK